MNTVCLHGFRALVSRYHFQHTDPGQLSLVCVFRVSFFSGAAVDGTGFTPLVSACSSSVRGTDSESTGGDSLMYSP